MSKPLVANRDLALYLGLGAWLAGIVLLWDAYENRGQERPKVFRLAGLFG